MYGPEIIDDLVRQIRTDVNRSTAHRVHRSMADRLRSLAHRAAR